MKLWDNFHSLFSSFNPHLVSKSKEDRDTLSTATHGEKKTLKKEFLILSRGLCFRPFVNPSEVDERLG